MPNEPKYCGLVADTMEDYTVTLFKSDAELEKRMLQIMKDTGLVIPDGLSTEDIETEWVHFTDNAQTKNGDRYHRFGFDCMPTRNCPVECC